MFCTETSYNTRKIHYAYVSPLCLSACALLDNLAISIFGLLLCCFRHTTTMKHARTLSV
ncbi:hypothetical protein D3C73_822570 [compost metagenome]